MKDKIISFLRMIGILAGLAIIIDMGIFIYRYLIYEFVKLLF